MRRFQKSVHSFWPLILALLLISCSASSGGTVPSSSKPANVVFFIADGCGAASYGLARQYQLDVEGVPKLHLDSYERGSVITFPDSIRVTDSAASATAFACAVKTMNGRIGMDSHGESVETVLEMAERAGYATGLISTARISHATPAAFSSHVISRDMEEEIASQQITKGIELLLGGGKRYYLPTEDGGRRTDGRNVIAEAQAQGYARVDDRAALMEAESLPLIGLFTDSHMAYEIDRDSDVEPSLAEMTTKSLELLSKTGKPFFIMIEAGRIDHAAHGNDPAAHLWDVFAYDEAWQSAIEFARADGATLVLGTSDHETGGLTLGAEHGGIGGSGYAYDPTKLQPVNSSIEYFTGELATRMEAGTPSGAWFVEKMRSSFNINVASFAEEIDQMMAVADTNRVIAARQIGRFVSRVTSDSARVGWSTGGHTSVNVPIFAFGPGSEIVGGVMDNTEVGEALRLVMGLE